jgi:hypothetical protein
LSRGPGRLERRIMELVREAPERRRTRAELDAVLVEQEGYFSTNTLRAIRSLVRKHRVSFNDRRDKADATVSLTGKAKLLTDDEVSALLAEVGR